MEGPIPPVPDRLVPQPQSRAEQRGRREPRQRERPFHAEGEEHVGAPAESAVLQHKPTHAHEDGVGERIDVTA